MTTSGLILAAVIIVLPWIGTIALYVKHDPVAHDWTVVSFLWTCFVVANMAILHFGNR